jgi:hypothetical protein
MESRKEKVETGWIVVRIFIGIVALIFLGYAIWGPESGDKIDQPWLADRMNGSWADWLGGAMFLLGCLWIMGVADWLSNKVIGKDAYSYGSKSDETKNIVIALILLFGGVTLFWNL